jgi:hypothetical protein
MNSEFNLYVIKGADGAHYIMPYTLDGICRLMEFMKKVIYGDELFHTEYTKANGKRVKTTSSLGKHMESLHSYSRFYSRDYTFSPLIEFFFEEYRKHQIKDYSHAIDEHDPSPFSTDTFNDFVITMRKNAATINLKKKVADWESKPKKNMKRLIEFEASLFKRYARLMVIRLDFNYHKATFTPEEVAQMLAEARRRKECDQADYLAGKDIPIPRVVEGRVALEEVQKDRKRLFTNMKGKPSLFEHLVGYVWRIEFGRQAGYHMHVLFFFDGAHVQKHEHIAQEIGYYWQDVITQGRSYFENCNRKKSRYGDAWALGQIDHWDGAKRDKLRNAMQYFCKTSQLVQVMPYAGCRLFQSGFVHRQRKVSGGRPRTKGIFGADH